jgi:hypothetical protein
VVVSLDDVRLIKDEDAGTFYYDQSGPDSGASRFPGGPAASARQTVFRSTPIGPAVARTGICSDRYSRRISAQFSTLSTPPLASGFRLPVAHL